MRTDKTYTTKTAIRKSKKDEGFTLIEVLIAISIFAVGLLAVATMQLSAIRVNSTAGQITALSTWGVDKLEELIALPYTDPQLQAAGNTHQTTPDVFTTVSWDIIDGTPATGTKLIRITVTGRGKTLRLVSVRSQSL